MKRKNRIRVAASAFAVTALVFTGVASAHAPQTIMIRHQMRNCHTWSFANGPFKASLKIRVDQDATIRFVNNDMMPHRLVQLAGPKAIIMKPSMNHMGAVAVLMFPGKGVYKFKTKFGEDYGGMDMKTLGKDNVLRLTVVVK